MPKGKVETGERSNKVRFVMLEADLNDSNVNILATAIVSALRPEPTPIKRLSSPAFGRIAAAVAAPSNGNENAEEAADAAAAAEQDDEDAVEQPAPPTGTASKSGPRKMGKPAQPDYDTKLFASTAEADQFKAFVEQHPTKKDSERYLIAAVYLRDHGEPVVNLHKIYTCYRTAEWPMTIKDWDVNLRNQIRNDRFRRVEGGYNITTQGEAAVQALRKK